MTVHRTEHALAVTYLRAPDANMLSRQRDHCRRAAAQLGAQIVGEYVDIGSSAASHRPGLDGVLARLHEPPPVRYVLVDRLDRLTRRTDEALAISDTITGNGAQLVQASDGGAIAPTPPYLRAVLLALAETPRPLLRRNAMDNDAVGRVIAAYDAMVRANTTPGHDAVRAVAEDHIGEVGWEVIETAERMGYAPADDDVMRLQQAASTYQARLAAEVGDEPAALDDTRSPADEKGPDR